MPTSANTQSVEALAALLRPYADRLDVVNQSSWAYLMQTKKPADKRPLMFAGVRVGKAYVSYHLVPIYMNEPLKATISLALRKRMQGKACFNFKGPPDAAQLEELRTLTEAAFQSFEKAGYI
ncbi:MAG: hypothetical protein M3169_18750 [Candidatus Eremiobacteraeota bacterium]|nr:hypothetical protein [Candidatus Eremiobacteraeota bacterium]